MSDLALSPVLALLTFVPVKSFCDSKNNGLDKVGAAHSVYSCLHG